jgi:hypothetical protein
MDTLSHTLLGAALCSKSGLGGGRRGAVDAGGRPKILDWTVWAAVLFGFLPDFCSLGWYLSWQVISRGAVEWRAFPPYIFTLYDITHSLVIAGAVILVLRLIKPALALPALAWPFHLLSDMVTHGEGRFTTPIFYPISDYGFHGFNWWKYPIFTYGLWAFIVLLWGSILLYRIRKRLCWTNQR